jgi:hypothetical protein
VKPENLLVRLIGTSVEHIADMPAEQACQMLWFDLLNNCEALHSAFPKGGKHCSDSFFGRDLPAFRPSDATVSS